MSKEVATLKLALALGSRHEARTRVRIRAIAQFLCSARIKAHQRVNTWNRMIPILLRCAACAIAAAGLTEIVMGQAGIMPNPPADLGTETLSANDGWASVTGAVPGPYVPFTVTGGSAAAPANIYTVTNLAQLKNALNAGGTKLSSTPKIIYILGEIDSVGKDGVTPLGPPDSGGTGPCSQFYATVNGTTHSECSLHWIGH